MAASAGTPARIGPAAASETRPSGGGRRDARTQVQTRRSLLHVWTPSAAANGRDVLLYPSLARLAADFDAVTAVLLRCGYRVLAVDPLVVDSAVPGGFRIADLVDDVVALLDRAGSATVDAIGHAFGSRVVRLLSIRNPERVRSIVCLACGGRVARPSEVTAALLDSFDLSLPDTERLDSIRIAFFAPDRDPAVWLDGWLPAIGAAEAAASLRTPDSEYFLGGRQPMLIVQGADDVTAPPENAALLRAGRTARGDHTTLAQLSAAGHALLPERPGAIARAVRHFLAVPR
ncbi:MAG: alpha/beta fold hydrolase [Candidatus Binatia bacterium]